MKTLLHFLKWQVGLAWAETQTTDAERDCLAVHATAKKCLVEIGVWHGVTTCRLRSAMAPEGMLYAVDPYPAGRLGISFQQRIAHAEVRRIRNGQVRWIRKTGTAAARLLASELAGRVELVFIDGDHSYEGLKCDWEEWSGLTAFGGVIALHDSRSTAARRIDDAGSVKYTQDVIRNDGRYQVIDEVDSLTVLRRQPS